MSGDLRLTSSGGSDVIFVIEREEVIRSALHFILDSCSDTRSFASLELALSGNMRTQPDLILLGIECLKIGREQALAEIIKQLPHTKVLIVADSPDDALARRAITWGAHDVIGKPISFASVRDGVDRLLRQRKRSAAEIKRNASAAVG